MQASTSSSAELGTRACVPHRVAWWLAALCGIAMFACPLASAWASDVPVVGVATGDATRGPLVDYIQAMDDLRLRTPGFDLVPASRTARLADAAAAPPRGAADNSVPEEVTQRVQTGRAAVDRSEWSIARDELSRALALLEKDGGARLPPGQTERWLEVRMLLATALVLDYPKSDKKRGTPSEDKLEAARVILRPVMDRLPAYKPTTAQYDEQVLLLLEGVRAELRRTGTLSVSCPVAGVDVYVNGVTVGQTPLQGYRLTAGAYQLEVGRPDRLSRVHPVEVTAGQEVSAFVDPNFESTLTTEGHAIYEAPPGQAAGPISVQVGRGIAELTRNRYGLVFAVEGANPLLLYAAMVDGQNGVVIRERTVEVQPGVVDRPTLHRLLLYVIEGREIDTAWPGVRWAWISGSVVTAGLVVTTAVLTAQATSKHDEGNTYARSDPRFDQIHDDGDQLETYGLVAGALSAVALGMTVWFLVLDLTREPAGDPSAELAPEPWRWFASPLVDARGLAGAAVGLAITF